MIVFLDGDESIRRALGRLFTSTGFAWEGFASAEEFLASSSREVACIVSDTSLPGMNGLELMRRFGKSQPGVPFIFLTSEDDEGIRRQARTAGASAFFRKPVDSEALLDSIRWTLHSPPQAALS